MNDLFDTPINPERQPVVRVRNGEVMADSRDVSGYFRKRHDAVIRDIRALISKEYKLGLHNFVEFKNNDLTGEHTSHYEMDRDGFTLLAMGFTGEKALKFKIAYIAQFNAMEAELRARPSDPIRVLSDPSCLRSLLLNYSERVIALEAKVESQSSTVAAYSRIAGSEGSLCITDAAKTLQIAPRALMRWLQQHDWIYRRAGNAQPIAYQEKIRGGWLEHKVGTVERRDGAEKTVTQVRITPKGLTKLASEVYGLRGAA